VALPLLVEGLGFKPSLKANFSTILSFRLTLMVRTILAKLKVTQCVATEATSEKFSQWTVFGVTPRRDVPMWTHPRMSV